MCSWLSAVRVEESAQSSSHSLYVSVMSVSTGLLGSLQLWWRGITTRTVFMVGSVLVNGQQHGMEKIRIAVLSV